MSLKHIFFVLAATGSIISTQAYASDGKLQASGQLTPSFTQADVYTLFEASDKHMQLATLSTDEMKETEGAWVWLFYLYGPQMTAAAMWGYNAAPRLGSTINSILYK
ncbi:MAG: hypothetical protein H3C26_13740 [Rhodocyclaceae bacterium]|nr:hypothetical protein [Rhodocyclaceae bacterium]